MENLAVLDYSTSEIHLYNIDTDDNINEDFIRNNLGLNPDECSWMFGENIKVTLH